jgi:FKBP-type peptidyl-prolyl cis-trans isomerase SlyD
VYDVTDETVTMNFNHPMAGKTLNFIGKVVEVRDATEKELQKGHPCKHHGDSECCHKGKGHHGDGECCHKEDSDCCNKDAE